MYHGPSHNDTSQRDMVEADLEKVMQIETASYDIPWTRKNFEDCLNDKNDCVLLISGQHTIGHAIVSYVLDEAHLLNICVDPRYAGKGFGRLFLQSLIRVAREKKCVMFFLEVRASNHRAMGLYQSEGFNEVGLRKGYYPAPNGREDAVLMTLDMCLDAYA